MHIVSFTHRGRSTLLLTVLCAVLGMTALGSPFVADAQARSARPTTPPTTPVADTAPRPMLRVSADSMDWSVELPPAYQAALQSVAPGFVPFTAENFNVGGWPTTGGGPGQGGTHGAAVADLNGDRRLEVALVGTVQDTMVTVVLLATRPGGVTGLVLSQAPWTSLPGPASQLTVDSVFAPDFLPTAREQRDQERAMILENRRTAGGRPRVAEVLSLERAAGRWRVRWQDSDCKSEGSQWILRSGGVVKQKSQCSYGE